MNNDKIEKGLIKTIGILEGRLLLDTRPNMVKQIIRSDYAMQKCLKVWIMMAKSEFLKPKLIFSIKLSATLRINSS